MVNKILYKYTCTMFYCVYVCIYVCVCAQLKHVCICTHRGQEVILAAFFHLLFTWCLDSVSLSVICTKIVVLRFLLFVTLQLCDHKCLPSYSIISALVFFYGKTDFFHMIYSDQGFYFYSSQFDSLASAPTTSFNIDSIFPFQGDAMLCQEVFVCAKRPPWSLF